MLCTERERAHTVPVPGGSHGGVLGQRVQAASPRLHHRVNTLHAGHTVPRTDSNIQVWCFLGFFLAFFNTDRF